eukprot:365497-Chlamydomonas_euryale.AAC.3
MQVHEILCSPMCATLASEVPGLGTCTMLQFHALPCSPVPQFHAPPSNHAPLCVSVLKAHALLCSTVPLSHTPPNSHVPQPYAPPCSPALNSRVLPFSIQPRAAASWMAGCLR